MSASALCSAKSMSSPSKRPLESCSKEPGYKIAKPDLMCQVILEKLPDELSMEDRAQPVSLVWCPPDTPEEQLADIGVDMEVDEVKTEDTDEVDEDTDSVATDDAISSPTKSRSPVKPASISRTATGGVRINLQSTTTARVLAPQLQSAIARARVDAAMANAVKKVAVTTTATSAVAGGAVGLTVKSILEAKRQASGDNSAARDNDNVRSMLAAKLQMSTATSAVPAPVTVVSLGNAVRLAAGANRPPGPFTLINLANTTRTPTAIRSCTPQFILQPAVGGVVPGVPVAVHTTGQAPRAGAGLAQPQRILSILSNVPGKMSAAAATGRQPVQKTPVAAAAASKTPTQKTPMSAAAASAAASSVTMNPNIDVSAIVLQSVLPNGAQGKAAAGKPTDTNTLAEIAARMISKQQQLVQIIASDNSASSINAVVLNRAKQGTGDGADHSYYVCEDVNELKRLLLESNARKHELTRKLKVEEQKVATWQRKAAELETQVNSLKKQLAQKKTTVVLQQPVHIQPQPSTSNAAAAAYTEPDAMAE